jgi:hypothetical protein
MKMFDYFFLYIVFVRMKDLLSDNLVSEWVSIRLLNKNTYIYFFSDNLVSEWVFIRLLNKNTYMYIYFFLDNVMSECPSDCYGHGDCVDGNCRCFAGFAGWDCKESKYCIIMMGVVYCHLNNILEFISLWSV